MNHKSYYAICTLACMPSLLHINCPIVVDFCGGNCTRRDTRGTNNCCFVLVWKPRPVYVALWNVDMVASHVPKRRDSWLVISWAMVNYSDTGCIFLIYQITNDMFYTADLFIMWTSFCNCLWLVVWMGLPLPHGKYGALNYAMSSSLHLLPGPASNL